MNNIKIKGFILALLVSVSPLSAGWFSDLNLTAKNCLSMIWNRKNDLFQTGVFSCLGSSITGHPCLFAGLCIAVSAPFVYKAYKNNQKEPNIQKLAQKAATVAVARGKQKRRWLPSISWPKWPLTSPSVQNDENIPSRRDRVSVVVTQAGNQDRRRSRNNKKPVQQRGIRFKSPSGRGR